MTAVSVGDGGSRAGMSIAKAVRRAVGKYVDIPRRWNRQDVQAVVESDKLLLGRMASWRVRSMDTLASLQDAEFKVSSQWGEDGIIDWLVERAQIPAGSCSFIEFGVENYEEANTRFLMQNRNWRGLIMDGSPAMLDATEKAGLRWRYDLTVKPTFITRENINSLIQEAGFTAEIGLLSVDVDGNDYWIWEAIDAVNPIICICEYNAVFGDVHSISVPYDPGFNRTNKHLSNLYFGASIAALRGLGRKKGYHFAGTTSAGNDAFFVREDYAARFLDTAIRDFNPAPSRVRESKDASGQLNYLRGLDRLRQIIEMPVVNTETGETVNIGDLGSVYSSGWAEAMTR